MDKEVLNLISWMLDYKRASETKATDYLAIKGKVSGSSMLIVEDKDKGRKLLIYTTANKAGERLLKIRLMRPYARDILTAETVRNYAGRSIAKCYIGSADFILA